MPARQLARLALVAAAVVASAASASSSQNSQPAVGNYNTSPPPPQAMDSALALGLWKSSFGAVKIENDDRGAAGAGTVHGVWVYDRQGTEVIGYFGGALRGNVLEFTWEEPAVDGSALSGAGYIVFDPYGQRFTGRWWTQARDRVGEWTGWRQDQGIEPRGEPEPAPYGGQTYGDGYEPPPPPPPPPGY